MKEEVQELINKLCSGVIISDLLPRVILLAKQLQKQDLEKWAKLELHGYYNTNPALTEKDIVPKYRTVAGLYYDQYNRPFIIKDSDLSFVNETRLRNSISELEGLSESKENFTRIVPIDLIQLIKENFYVDVHYFSFPTASIKNILNKVRMDLIEELASLEIEIGKIVPKDMKELKSKFDSLVVKGKLNEALDLLAPNILNDIEFKNEVTLQKARLGQLEKTERLGTSDQNYIGTQRLKLVAAIISLGEKVLNKI